MAEELGGMLALAILKVVGEQIGSAIGGQITLQEDLSKDLEKMKMALESVLTVTERRSITEEPTRLWLKRLKDISYMIDELEADTLGSTQPSSPKFSLRNNLAAIIPCLPIGPKITLANRMKTMRENLEVITSEYKSYNLLEGTNANELKVIDMRETSSKMGTEIIGRTEEKDKILASLADSITKDMTVLPIYGIGGLDKTTLAEMVSSSSQFQDYSKVWVYVSQTFDLNKIGNSIISQLWENEKILIQHTARELIEKSLRKLLAGKKILIVLDDLWEDNKSHLDDLVAMLKVGEGSNVVVIVTTRDEGIANKISTTGTKPHKLAAFTDDLCWSIIQLKSEFESRDDKKELELIGKEIARKCGGVALAAHSLGHMLHSMTESEWKSVRDSDIWSTSASDKDSTLAALRLSYSVMPSDLKLCFAYCAIFPKGYKIVKIDLIHQWVSLGFIQPTNISSSWQLGEKFIKQLLGLSFLQDSKSSSNRSKTTSLTMHDLVHDLARHVLDDEILVASKHGSLTGSCCRYALLNDCSKTLESPKIRALHFQDSGEIRLHDAVFLSAKSLRVLDLSQCSIHKLSDSIGRLKQLRYLNAPRIQYKMIPNSITRLSKLIYLNLSYAIKALPESIGEIEGLMYLDLSGCSGIKALPESIGEIKELVYLDLSGCSELREVPESLGVLKKLLHLDLSNCFYVRGVSVFLASLTELKYLSLSGCRGIEELPSLFGNLKNLVHLDLSNCYNVKGTLEALDGFVELQYLNLSTDNHEPNKHLHGSAEVISNLTELRYLNLSYCMEFIFGTQQSYSSIADQIDSFICRISRTLSNLEQLDLSYNPGIVSLPESLYNLRKLHTLDLSYCKHLRDIPESLCTIDRLKFVYTKGCMSLSKAPQLGSSAISLPHFMVYAAADGNSSSNLVLLQHPKPDVLSISGLENVKSVEEAHCIKLSEKQRLVDLTLKWTGDVERFVDDKLLLEKLVPPNTLQGLEIQGYNGISFPAWLIGQLPNLCSLVLSSMKYLEDWNDVPCSSANEEHVIDLLYIHDCPKLRLKWPPPRVKRLMISNSDNVLLSWGECTMSHAGVSSTSSLVTEYLEVECSHVPMHRWGLLHQLRGLTGLKIKECYDLTASPAITRRLSSLESLDLEDKDLEELPQWLGELLFLRKLRIKCKGVKELHENMRQLTKLQSLTLDYCKSMASLPHWLGELTSLKELSIMDCAGITSLPESIQQLTNLQELWIHHCHVLKQWCESEENETKLAHLEKNKRQFVNQG